MYDWVFYSLAVDVEREWRGSWREIVRRDKVDLE